MIVSKTPQTPAAVAAHYDDLDVFYREIWGEHVHHGYFVTGRETIPEATENLITHLAEVLDLRAGQKVVDIGCGYGATARVLADRHEVQVVGLTLSAVQLARAQAQTVRAGSRGSLTFLQQDWLTNTLPETSFDRAYAVESSEHMPDKAAFFRQAFRVLAPGGVFGVYVWLAADAPSAWEVDHLLEPICREGRLPGMGTEGEYRKMAEDAGFVPQVAEDLSAQVSRTWALCAQGLTRNVLTKPRYLRALLDHTQGNRIFALTLFRLLLAYRSKAMRYCLLTYTKP